MNWQAMTWTLAAALAVVISIYQLERSAMEREANAKLKALEDSVAFEIQRKQKAIVRQWQAEEDLRGKQADLEQARLNFEAILAGILAKLRAL